MSAPTRVVVPGYRPRAPLESLYYRLVRDHWKNFLAAAEAREAQGRGLPKHVVKAFEAFLDCGVLSKGFARLRCPGCRYDLVVPFS
jgi:hypothetical protein